MITLAAWLLVALAAAAYATALTYTIACWRHAHHQHEITLNPPQRPDTINVLIRNVPRDAIERD